MSIQVYIQKMILIIFKKLNINEIKQNLVNSNLTDDDITEKIENKIFL